MSEQQRCGTCKWFKAEGDHGQCTFPMPYWLTAILEQTEIPYIQRSIAVVLVNEGHHCPTYEAHP